MIFEVYLDDKLLYYPNDETFVITNSQLELALNEAGSFEFDVPSCNLRYDEFNLRSSMVRVLQNGTEIFYGEVREVTQNFDFTKHVYVVGELAFLFDSIQPQYQYQCAPMQMFQALLNNHNAQVEERKRFTIGYVQVTDPNDYIYRYTNREDTLTALRDKLCDSLDGYLRIRKDSNGKRYLDLVPIENYGTYCKQEIQFGENLINYSCNFTSSDIATCVIPLGKRLEDEERTNRAVPELDEYLTIVGQPVDDYHKHINDDYVQLDSAIKSYGYVRVVKNWDEVTTANELKSKAIKWLKSAQYETMILELNALDLSLMDANIDSFDIGDTIHAWALPFGMDTTFPVQKKTIFLNDLSKNTVVLGSSYQKSYTSQASNAVNLLEEELPEISPILKMAKENALAMLLAETTGGHVVYEYDATNSYITAINVINTPKLKSATQRWVWNLSGLGYMKRDKASDPWSDLGVAMTMDGRIVADFITAGVMSGDHIKGGTIEVGGKDYAKDGSIVVKNASGTPLVTLDKNGMKLSGGQTISYTNISDKPSIPDNFDDLDGTITSTQITDGAVITDKIAANAVNASKISVKDLSAISAKLGSVNVGGNNNENGSIVVTNKDGTELIRIDKDGITLSNGQKIKYTDISGTPSIPSTSDITTITESTISTHTFKGNSYYSTDEMSWFAPNGVADKDFRNQTVTFKIDGDYPLRIDNNGIIMANRIITGSEAGVINNWGVNSGWAAMLDGGIVGHPKNDRYYYMLDFFKLYTYFDAMGMSYSLNPVTRFEANVFK